MNRIKQLWFPLAILAIILVTVGWILALVINPSNVRSSEQVFLPTDTPVSTIVPTEVPTSTSQPSLTPTAVATGTPIPGNSEVIPTATPEPVEALNCTYTIHYWRAYTDAWGIDHFEFDDRSYSKEQAIAILNLEDPNLVTTRLLQQYFVALLNTTNGADSSGINRTLEQVNDWLNQHPPEAGLTQEENLEGETFADALQDYNDGVTGPGRCLDEPLTPTPGSTPTPFNYTPPATATNTSPPGGTIVFVPTPTPTKKSGGDGGSKPKPTSPPPTKAPTNPPPPPPTDEPPPPTKVVPPTPPPPPPPEATP